MTKTPTQSCASALLMNPDGPKKVRTLSPVGALFACRTSAGLQSILVGGGAKEAVALAVVSKKKHPEKNVKML